MLLAMDIGNTNTTIGVFREKELVATFRMTTKQQRTSDEFGIDLCSLLVHNKINKDEIHAVITASVVPDVMYSLNRAISKYLSLTAVNVEYGIETGIKIMTDHPAQVGADRVVDAVAAYEIYGGPVLVIDFGTATTYDVVNEKENSWLVSRLLEFRLVQKLCGAKLLSYHELKLQNQKVFWQKIP